MRQWFIAVLTAMCALGFPHAPLAAGAELGAAHGKEIVFRQPLNPPIWSVKAYDNVWKLWGVSEKPANYQQAFMERYGMHPALMENNGRPMGLVESQGILSRGLVNNCLLCHAGTVAGQTTIGLGNAAIDLQGLFEDLTAADGFKFTFPYQFSYVRGTIDPISPTAFLMAMRDPELNLQKPKAISYEPCICSDPPAWWLIKKKKTRDWTGSIDARSSRVDMVNLLTPFNSASYIKKHEATFADIEAYLRTIEAPKYPFPVDDKLAARGLSLFAANCAKCHGTYGPNWTYPNKIVSTDVLGTDPLLARAGNATLMKRFNDSWLAREIGPDGKPIQLAEHDGYQAPPLDGIWATTPYFHNGSVPTVYHVLNSKARPTIFTRSFKTDSEAYDREKLGWKIERPAQPPSADAPGYEQRKVYNTTLPGRHNTGHTFGDKLTEEERMAVIEYLKTL